jgi:hypothetical protein
MSRRWFVLGLGALAAWPASFVASARECVGNEPPPAFVALYEAKASRGALAVDGEVALDFKRNGDQYTLTSKMEAVGYFSEQESRGRVAGATLLPSRYREMRSRRAEASATIDWPAHRVSFSDGSEAPTRPALQDRLSLLVQLSAALRAKPDADTLVFEVASVKHIGAYRFERRGPETLRLPAGTIETIRFERVDDQNDRLEVWLAPARCALPVRLRLRDHRGTEVDQRLRELRFD